VTLLAIMPVFASALTQPGTPPAAPPAEMRVIVKPDGSVWARADAYAKLVGATVEVEDAAGLMVVCHEDRCFPLHLGVDAEIVDGKPYARVDRLVRALGIAEAAGPGVGLRPGDMAPDFTLESLDGKHPSLHDYRGRKVLVFAWASW
jgi:hypothetical protein